MELLDRVTKNLSDLGAFLMSTPEARRFQQAEAEQAQQTRAALAAEARRLNSELDAEHHRYVAEREPLSTALASAEAQVEAAREAVASCERAHRLAVLELDRLHSRCHGQLRVTAPAEIEAFASEMRAEVAAAQKQLHVRGEITSNGYEQTWDNKLSVEARQSAAVRAAHDVSGLALEALTPDELTQRLDAMRAALPAVEPTPAKAPAARFFR
jgi:hypothetical protein